MIQATKVTTLILIQMTAIMRRNYPYSKRWGNTGTTHVRHGSFEKKKSVRGNKLRKEKNKREIIVCETFGLI